MSNHTNATDWQLVYGFPFILSDYDNWELTKPNWYTITYDGSHMIGSEFLEKYIDKIKWIYENIDAPKKHCRWTIKNYKMHFKFRYERDYIWFGIIL